MGEMGMILMGIVLGFIVASFWHYVTVKKQRAIFGIAFKGLINDANKMAQKLGHKGLIEYYKAEKGSQYALNAEANINATIKDFFLE